MIGVFDSGVGGLTVVREIREKLPNIGIRYLGDTARLPYGTKSERTIQRYIEESFQFLVKNQDLSAIVIACNTASTVWLQAPRNWRKKLGRKIRIPVLDVVQPAVEQARKVSFGRRVGVIGTPTTIRSGVYQRYLNDFLVITQSCPLLVPFIEEGWAMHKEAAQKVLSDYLKPLRRARVDTLILGCTHYPLIEQEIRAIMGKDVVLVNSARMIAEVLQTITHHTTPKGIEVFVTDEPYRFDAFSRAILGKRPKARLISLG